MAIGDTIVGLDIGASSIRAVVGEVNNFKQIEILADENCKTNGIEKGQIVDEEAVADSIRTCIKDIEKELNKKIKSSYVTIPSSYVTIVQNSVEKDTKDKYSGITQKDIQAIFNQIRGVDIPNDSQIIDVLFNDFELDNGKKVKDPVGEFSSKYKVETQIILGKKDYLKKLYNVLKKADLEIDGIVPSILAEKDIVVSGQNQKETYMIIDVGAEYTDIAIFDHQKFIYNSSIPIGGQNVTNDLAIVLNISKEEAEKLKKQYGLALRSYMENDTDVILNTAKDDTKMVRSSKIVSIIEARIEQLFDLINQNITDANVKRYINNVTLVGDGIINLNKSDIVSKIKLNIPTKMVSSKVIDLIKPQYITSFGLIRYISERPFSKKSSSTIYEGNKESVFKKLMGKVKDFFYS